MRVIGPHNRLFDFIPGFVGAGRTFRIPRKKSSVTQFDNILAIEARPNVVVHATDLLFDDFGRIKELVILFFIQQNQLIIATLAVASAIAEPSSTTDERDSTGQKTST